MIFVKDVWWWCVCRYLLLLSLLCLCPLLLFRSLDRLLSSEEDDELEDLSLLGLSLLLLLLSKQFSMMQNLPFTIRTFSTFLNLFCAFFNFFHFLIICNKVVNQDMIIWFSCTRLNNEKSMLITLWIWRWTSTSWFSVSSWHIYFSRFYKIINLWN